MTPIGAETTAAASESAGSAEGLASSADIAPARWATARAAGAATSAA
jgi:hypothetical protein